MNITDSDRINFLQKLMVEEGSYTKKCILRPSTNGRGYRLHETSWPQATDDVREAIDNIIKKNL